MTQRNNGTLSADRIAKLDALGFVWASSRKTLVDGEGISADWQARFDELLRYKETHMEIAMSQRSGARTRNSETG